MKKFLVTYDIKHMYDVHTLGDTVPIPTKNAVNKLKNALTTNGGVINIDWEPEKEYPSNFYAFIEAEDQDSAIEQFLAEYNTAKCKVVRMMIADLSHVYKVPLE